MNLIKSDPRLTSFVLDELSETEMNEIQAAINADPELQTEIESIRQTIKEIETAMKNEPLPENFKNSNNIITNNEKPTISPKHKNWFQRLTIPTVTISSLIVLVIAGGIIYNTSVSKRHVGHVIHCCEELLSLENDSTQNKLIQSTVEDIALSEEIEISTPEPPAMFDLKPKEMTSPIGRPDNSTSGTNAGSGITELKESTLVSPSSDFSGESAPMGGGSREISLSGALPAPTSVESNSSFRTRSENTSKSEKNREIIAQNSSGPVPRSGLRKEYKDQTIGKKMNSPYPVVVTNDNDPKNDPYNSANDEAYKNTSENEFKPVKVGEFSTFSIDVDTASYTTMRRYLNETAKCPPIDSVRIEEYINYFKYDYALPTDGKPFATHIDISPCPWESKHLLARIGIKGKEYSVEERPSLNLVFLIDVSGSMAASNRLPLVKRGLTELVEMLQPKDRVAIVTYAGTSSVVLPSISGQEKRAILDSINGLGAGGSTAGAAGIKTAYETARKYYDKKAQNRVILCTDGDFNVGETNNKTLEEMIGDEAKSGVFLTILGFGMGNYKDERLKTLSMRGNGNYGYIDTPEEARKLLVEGLTGTLFAIAKDVKIQVDFNPARVAGYRLIGYENRKLRDKDFHNDKIDAGEIGAGHTVTALYEIVPTGENVPATVDKSRYDNRTPEQKTNIPADNSQNSETKDVADETGGDAAKSKELMFVKLRYKLPDENKSSLLEYPVSTVSNEMSGDSQFAAAVALFGMLLRESRYSGNGSYDSVLELATPNTNNNQYRKEFIELVKKAKNNKN
ncbi:MAG: von Willebrand factor type A domain-containing protein, partial [Planctomycetaceae bacterium]|nr:von Willebrand factor type A domain-containing protein [Planctomycetaceae bacterium]